METLLKGLGIGVIGVVVVGILACVGGTIVWLVWPVAIPAAFPGLVASGVLAANLGWWQSVLLTWIFGILIKSSNSQTNNNK